MINQTSAENQEPNQIQPIVRVIDLELNEQQTVQLADGNNVDVKLLKLIETRDPIRKAVRKAVVTLEIEEQQVKLESGMYNLPQKVGRVKVDCSVTRGYNSNGNPAFWGLDKAARIRLWPADYPFLKQNSFIYPVKQRWFSTLTWFDNEPVDGGVKILPKIYYHSGLDIGGAERLTEVVAATDALIVSAGLDVLEGHEAGTYSSGSPVAKRYDVVYLQDERGWYYRYSHLANIDHHIKPGRFIKKGTLIGYIGKEGASGGWSHLHFEIKAKQPSGKWGTQAGYAFLREAYLKQYKPKLLAHARPGKFIKAGDTTILDGSLSWSAAGKIASYQWIFEDGTTQSGVKVSKKYLNPGNYHDILKVTDVHGNIDYDFIPVRVIDPRQNSYPTNVHANYWPTFGIKPGDAVTFKVRAFNFASDDRTGEVWDFGDGSPAVTVHSTDGRNRHMTNKGMPLPNIASNMQGITLSLFVKKRTREPWLLPVCRFVCRKNKSDVNSHLRSNRQLDNLPYLRQIAFRLIATLFPLNVISVSIHSFRRLGFSSRLAKIIADI